MDYYEITVKSHLDYRRIQDFEGLKMEHLPDGCTVIHGYIKDQAFLYSVLNRFRDMGIQLLQVSCRGQIDQMNCVD